MKAINKFKRKNVTRNKNHKKSDIKKKKISKILYIIFLFLINIYMYIFVSGNFLLFSKKENESNYDWRKNTQELIDKQISILNGKLFEEFERDYNRCKFYFTFRDYDEKGNLTYKNEMKEQLIQKFSNRYEKDFRYVKNIAINKPFSFGNQISAINNIIYYCEILGIKNIYFNSKEDFYLKNDTVTDKIHIWIIPEDKYDCSSKETFCGQLFINFFYPVEFKPKRRSLILKDEIKRNLPQVKINKDDLYIYIRAGDSFYSNVRNGYIPSPYCFYERIITKYKFNDIYIISIDDKHPAIGKLMSTFPKIKHQLKNVKTDIALLMNAYNLANSMSSFTQAAISFNDNLENLFDYEAYKASEALLHFHYDIDKLNRRFNVYRMKPSENYLRNIYNWCNTQEQRQLILEENCINDFVKTIY